MERIKKDYQLQSIYNIDEVLPQLLPFIEKTGREPLQKLLADYDKTHSQVISFITANLATQALLPGCHK